MVFQNVVENLTGQRVRSIDTEDLAGIISVLLGATVLSGGVTTFYTYDLTSVMSFSLGSYTVGFPAILVILGLVYIAFTNDIETAEMFDYNATEGLAFLASVGGVVLYVVEPTFVTNNLIASGSVAGAMLMTAVHVLLASVLATQ